MAQRRPIDVMLELLHAQRSEVALRASLARDSQDWVAATKRLDDLNERIMQVADVDADRREPLGNGVQLALDSRPIDDVPFRREVIDAVRRALSLVKLEALSSRAASRVAAAEERVQATNLLVERARRSLRERYPDATLNRAADEATNDRAIEAGTLLLTLRADREGRVA